MALAPMCPDTAIKAAENILSMFDASQRKKVMRPAKVLIVISARMNWSFLLQFISPVARRIIDVTDPQAANPQTHP